MAATPLVRLDTVAEFRQFVREKRVQNPETSVAFVPTMGALHQGHLELVRRARTCCAHPLVAVSIFVNPLQFGPGEDFGRYPRTLQEDLAKLEGLADCVFVPEAAEILPKDNDGIGVIVGGNVGRVLEASRRPNYMSGMLSIVAALFNIVQPQVALFGEKDAQQLFAIQQMVRVLHFPIRILPVETVREPDGLAMSSRNRYLSAQQRAESLRLYRALQRAKTEADRGKNLRDSLSAAKAELEGGQLLELDYLGAVDARTFAPIEGPEEHRGPALVLVAAALGQTRLIDNIHINFAG